MKYFLKVICGYRKDQEYSIDADEAHKVYYLFHNPEKRAVFSDGIALKGDQIQTIKPDYHKTMGWNETYLLTDDDMNEIRNKGIDIKIRNAMEFSKGVAQLCPLEDLATPLIQLKGKYSQLLLPQHRNSGSVKNVLEAKYKQLTA